MGFKTINGRKVFIDDNRRTSSTNGRNDESEGMKIGSGTRIPTLDEDEDTLLDIDDLGSVSGEPVVAFIRDFSGKRSKHKVTLEIELKNKDKTQKGVDGNEYEDPLELSISGSIWQRDETDSLSGGQIDDDLREALRDGKLEVGNGISDSEMKELLDIWDKYHLNDLSAGTERQNEIIEENKDKPKYNKFDKFLDRPKAILEDFDAEPDKETEGFGDEGYSYGSAWLFQPLPEDVVDFVEKFKRKLESGE